MDEDRLHYLRKFYPPGVPLRAVARKRGRAARNAPPKQPPSVEHMAQHGFIWDILTSTEEDWFVGVNGEAIPPGGWRCVACKDVHIKALTRAGRPKEMCMGNALQHYRKHHAEKVCMLTYIWQGGRWPTGQLGSLEVGVDSPSLYMYTLAA